MSEINTTPLIDVMLVLLVMLIITIPMTTHEVPVDLPQIARFVPDRQVNTVSISDRDQVLWNGQTVTLRELASLLQQIRTFPVEPELQFEPEANAGYGVAAETLNIIEKSGVSNFGFAGNERFRRFGRD